MSLDRLEYLLANEPHHDDEAVHMKFGGLRRMLRRPFGHRNSGVRKVVRGAGNLIHKKVLPIALPIAGTLMGGPLGSVAGGALGGALKGGHHRPGHSLGKDMLKGGLMGAAIGGAVNLGQMLFQNAQAGGGLGETLRNVLGGNIGGQGPKEAAKSVTQNQRGFLEQFLRHPLGSKDSGLRGALGKLGLGKGESLLLGGGLLTSLFGKQKPPRAEDQQAYDKIRNAGNPDDRFPLPKKTPYMREINPNYGKNIDYDKPYYDEDAFLEERPYIPQYADGGYVHGGFIDGESGGTEDNVDTHIPEGSFVVDATTTSLLGDGQSRNGKRKLEELNEEYSMSPITQDWNKQRFIHVKLSPGEFVVSPEAVKAIGNGSGEKGAKKINKMRKKIRKDKGLTKFLPPKSKSLENYLR